MSGYDPRLRDALVRVRKTKRFSVQRCYPVNAVIASFNAGAAGAFGAWTEIVPVNTITSDFLLLGFTLGCQTGIAIRTRLSQGLAGAEQVIGFDESFAAAALAGVMVSFDSPSVVPANSRIAMSVTTNQGTVMPISWPGIQYALLSEVA